MKHKGINVITSLLVLLPGLPVAARETNMDANIFSNKNLQLGTDVVKQTSALIETVCNSVQVETVSSNTENALVEEYYHTSPVYYSTVEEVPAESGMQMTYEAEETVVSSESPVDISLAQQNYENALTMYNEALEQYNSANEIIENQEEVEVEVLQEIVDEEGNVSIITNVEVQTVITTETAGDVGAAQEVLNQTSLQLSEAENALAQAQSDSVIREEDLITAVQDSELKAVNEESNKCGDNATWSISDSGILTVTGSGDMYDYASGSETPWISEKLRINHIVIDTGITRVGNYTFNGCDHIQTVYIYDTTTSVGIRAFDSCTRLKGVHFGNSVTAIEAAAFNNCPVLETLEFNNSLEIIGNNAFEKCPSIDQLVLPDSLITVGSQAFSSCTGLTSVHFGNSTTTIGASAFRNCSALKVVEFNNSLQTIERNVFDGCQAIEEIELPDSLVTIGSYAFNRCWSLRNVDLGTGVKIIGSQAFYDCNKIENIVIPSSVNTIDAGAFNQCKSLTNITFNEGLSKIGISAFNACVNLLTVNLPVSVTSIGLKAFEACESLMAINVNENNSYYTSVNGVLYSKDTKTLINCPGGLTEANIIGSVTSIAQFAFSSCEKITSLVLPNTLLSIGQSAFFNCSSLNSIILPDSITDLGVEAFKSCQALESAIISSGLNVLSAKVFSGCSSLTTIILAKTIESIDETAFEFCNALSDVYYRGKQSDWEEKDITIVSPHEVTMHYMTDYILQSQHTLSLQGNVEVNFYLEFDEELLSDSAARVVFDFNNNTYEYSLSEGTPFREFIKFSVSVPSVMMTADIKLHVLSSKGDIGYTETYRAKDYCDNKLADSTLDPKLRTLLEALLNYGGYAQIQFNVNTDNLANADLEDTDVSDVTIEQLAPYESVTTGSLNGLSFVGSTLTLNSLTTIKHYFTVETGHTIDEFNFVMGDTVLTPIPSGSMYYVEIPNIASKDLDETYTVTVGDFSVQYSALSYAYTQLNKSAAPDTLKNVCRAVYKYNQAANAQFNS